MKTFMVQVCRISYGFASFEVAAENEEDAKNKAEDMAGDHIFSEKSSDYEAQGAQEIPSGKDLLSGKYV